VIYLQNNAFLIHKFSKSSRDIFEKSKPGETRGRKATGHMKLTAGPPKKIPLSTPVFDSDAGFFCVARRKTDVSRRNSFGAPPVLPDRLYLKPDGIVADKVYDCGNIDPFPMKGGLKRSFVRRRKGYA
jgi:hypothetical protein